LASSHYAASHCVILPHYPLFPVYCYEICFSEPKKNHNFNVINGEKSWKFSVFSFIHIYTYKIYFSDISMKFVKLSYGKNKHNANLNFFLHVGWILSISLYELAPQPTCLAELFTEWQQAIITWNSTTIPEITTWQSWWYVLTAIFQQTVQSKWCVCGNFKALYYLPFYSMLLFQEHKIIKQHNKIYKFEVKKVSK
jgi:hypothetical protein